MSNEFDLPPGFPDLEQPRLPFWMAGPELAKLASAGWEWFRKLGRACIWPARQLDPMTANLDILDLIAWGRGISRYAGEAERLYRLRVKYAYPNAVDSGQAAGWHNIFERLELGKIGLWERMPGADWDVVGLVIDDSQMGAVNSLQDVLEIIIAEYGRTCRRYRFISTIKRPCPVSLGIFDEDHFTVEARAEQRQSAAITRRNFVFDNDSSFMEAKWQAV